MKVILNQDVSGLGELGDIKEVAAGYARNYLIPRNLAVLCTAKTIALFEKRAQEIAALKEQKMLAARSIKDKLESTELNITVPAGANGKLYGAVTNATIYDELHKLGFNVERKRIEIPGHTIKSTGTYKFVVRLYEKEEATVKLTVLAQEVKEERADHATAHADKPKRERKERVRAAEDDSPEAQMKAFLAAQGVDE